MKRIVLLVTLLTAATLSAQTSPQADRDLKGAIDLHIYTEPDSIARSIDARGTGRGRNQRTERRRCASSSRSSGDTGGGAVRSR